MLLNNLLPVDEAANKAIRRGKAVAWRTISPLQKLDGLLPRIPQSICMREWPPRLSTPGKACEPWIVLEFVARWVKSWPSAAIFPLDLGSMKNTCMLNISSFYVISISIYSSFEWQSARVSSWADPPWNFGFILACPFNYICSKLYHEKKVMFIESTSLLHSQPVFENYLSFFFIRYFNKPW